MGVGDTKTNMKKVLDLNKFRVQYRLWNQTKDLNQCDESLQIRRHDNRLDN